MILGRYLASPALALSFFICCPASAFAQSAISAFGDRSTLPQGTPLSWIEAAGANELRIVDEDGEFPVRYLVHKLDRRGDTVRDTIESSDGTVARLIARNGKPLSAQEDQSERERLQELLDSPSAFAKHKKRNDSAREYASDLIRLMPRAMIYTYAPGQPQVAGSTSRQAVIDFVPDPRFEPPSMIAELLTGIEGRLWIDVATHVVVRGEARVKRPVNFGWGVLARIYPGGTVAFEQMPLGDGQWIYSHVDEHLKIREVLFKTANQNSTMTASSVRKLPAQLSYQDAIRELLNSPLPSK